MQSQAKRLPPTTNNPVITATFYPTFFAPKDVASNSSGNIRNNVGCRWFHNMENGRVYGSVQERACGESVADGRPSVAPSSAIVLPSNTTLPSNLEQPTGLDSTILTIRPASFLAGVARTESLGSSVCDPPESTTSIVELEWSLITYASCSALR